MGRSWRLGSAFGIGIYVHWSFALLPGWVLFVHWLQGNHESAGFFLALVLATFGCIVLHELGHALMARVFGIGTRDITLYPIGGVARLNSMTRRPVEELVIAVAGPAVNVVIALILGTILLLVAAVHSALVTDTSVGQFFLWLMVSNLFLVLFNMIPAFPMDGGRVLRALLAMGLGQLHATRIAVWLGGVLALCLGIVGIFPLGQPMLPVLAVFVFLAGQQELQAVEARHARVAEDLDLPADLEPPLTVLPAFSYRPSVTVYVWDHETGTWIRQTQSPYHRACDS
jgi:Zn-dependent protease